MHIAIIGNGISGITAARHIRKLSDHKITVISAETDHFFSRTALMYIYMGHMKYENTKPYEDWFWKKNRIDLIRNFVEIIDTDKKILTFSDHKTLSFDKLILATGSKPNKFGWSGQDLEGVQGLYSYQDLENMEKNTKDIEKAVIVGGGLIGIEMAEMLLTRNISVTMLVRESSFWNGVLPEGESDIVNRHILEHHIDLRLSSELDCIDSDDNGKVKSVTTKSGETINCQFVGITAGVSPNIDFIKKTKIDTGRGINVNHYLETNISDIYAIGDCAEFLDPLPNRRPIEQVWYTGKIMGETVAKTICGNKTKYEPGIWFNSAKFLDIEYQTYGWVLAKSKENESNFYWEHQDGKKCLHLVFDKNDKHILGFNVFGIRLRHEVCERWLANKKTIDYVLENLYEANFDPEFYKKYEPEIISKYNQKFSKKLKSKRKKSILSIFGI